MSSQGSRASFWRDMESSNAAALLGSVKLRVDRRQLLSGIPFIRHAPAQGTAQPLDKKKANRCRHRLALSLSRSSVEAVVAGGQLGRREVHVLDSEQGVAAAGCMHLVDRRRGEAGHLAEIGEARTLGDRAEAVEGEEVATGDASALEVHDHVAAGLAAP